MRLTVTHTKDEVDYDLVVEYVYDAGKYSGPPENCYEASENCSILEANIEGVKVEVPEWGDADLDAICEKARELAEAHLEEQAEREYERRGEE